METKTLLELRSAGVDTESALRRMGGNAELYERFLFKFKDDDTFRKIETAIAENDYDAALRAAHTLKGVSANLGMNHLSDACAKIVKLIQSGLCEETTQELAQEYPRLKSAHQRICHALSQDIECKW